MHMCCTLHRLTYNNAIISLKAALCRHTPSFLALESARFFGMCLELSWPKVHLVVWSLDSLKSWSKSINCLISREILGWPRLANHLGRQCRAVARRIAQRRTTSKHCCPIHRQVCNNVWLWCSIVPHPWQEFCTEEHLQDRVCLHKTAFNLLRNFNDGIVLPSWQEFPATGGVPAHQQGGYLPISRTLWRSTWQQQLQQLLSRRTPHSTAIIDGHLQQSFRTTAFSSVLVNGQNISTMWKHVSTVPRCLWVQMSSVGIWRS